MIPSEKNWKAMSDAVIRKQLTLHVKWRSVLHQEYNISDTPFLDQVIEQIKDECRSRRQRKSEINSFRARL